MTLGCWNILLKKERAGDGWMIILFCDISSGIGEFYFICCAYTYNTNPIMDLHAFKDKNFTLGCFFLFLEGLGYSLLYI